VVPAFLFARVDLVPDEAGTLRLMELELVEPRLRFADAPWGLERLLQATAARCTAGARMDKCIVLGVDGDFSLPTQYALRTASDLFEQAALGLHFILLTVIPLPYDPSPTLMKCRGIGQLRPLSPTSEQQGRALEVLGMASALLQRRCSGLGPLHIETVQRFGDPAEEMVRLARERWADCIVLGGGGNSARHTLRRVFGGSTSGDIVRLAPCPVIIVTPPRLRAQGTAPWCCVP
jgi:nucleotide-binding universal stress UspA family protein